MSILITYFNLCSSNKQPLFPITIKNIRLEKFNVTSRLSHHFFPSSLVCFLNFMIFLFASTYDSSNISFFALPPALSSFFSALRASFIVALCRVSSRVLYTNFFSICALFFFYCATFLPRGKAIAPRLKSLLILLLHFTLVFPS